MATEYKFTPLQNLKVTDDGPGFIEGYRSVFNVIDEGGDIIIPGAFKDCLAEYLDSGFTAHSHDWDFDKVVGFPIEAREDDHGWFVKSQFHSTPDAQNIRIKAKERKEAGKKVGFSFGYAPTEFTHIEAKDYETEIAKYVKAENLPAQLAKAQKFNRIRVLKKVDAIEDSLVTAPMNKHAAATAIKSGLNLSIVDEETKTIRKCKEGDGEQGKPWCLYSSTGKLLGRHATREDAVAQEQAIEANKGMLAEEMRQTTPSIWEVESAFHRVVRKIAETAKNVTITGTVFDWQAKVDEVCNEYPPAIKPIIINQITEYLDSSDDEFYLKGIAGTESFESFESMESVLKKFTENMQRNHENRVKEGRVLSGANRSKVIAARDALNDLLAASEPPAKVNVMALKAQHARISHRLVSEHIGD